MSDDDRIDYLAGEPAGPLDPAERADLDDLRALLAEPAVWAEPGPDLEDNVTAAVARAAASARADPGGSVPAGVARPRRGRRPIVIAAVAGLAAAATAAAIAVAVSLGGGSHPTQYRAALAGTALAPAATGQVTLIQTPSGWRITLHGRGLPASITATTTRRG